MAFNKPIHIPDPAALESFDDLIREQQQQQQQQQQHPNDDNFLTITRQMRRRSSSGANTIVPNHSPNNTHLHPNEYENPNSSSSSDRGLEDSTVTIRPTPASPPRDESRWNGFHLPRLESYQRRVERQEQMENERVSLERINFSKRIWQKGRNWWKERMYVGNVKEDGSIHITKTRMIVLTLVLAGAQIAWCLELGYGTPFLLSLGMSKSTTSLCWLAAPLSGLIVQPLIGVFSDLSSSPYRRRQYIVWSTVCLVICTILLAFSTPIASFLADLLHAGLADWDPVRQRASKEINQSIAILGFLGLDLSVNGIQVAGRALMLDSTPSSMHSKVNAWAGRMQHVANVIGYGIGWYNLSSSKWLHWIGGGQFRKYCMVSIVLVTLCSTITCVCIEESHDPATPIHIDGPMIETHATASTIVQHQSASGIEGVQEAFMRIWDTVRRLPRSIRRICVVQVFAYMGYFPFLFYATEWVIEVWQEEQSKQHPFKAEPIDRATEIGSFSLLLFSLVSLAAGVLLPFLSLVNWTSKPVQLDVNGGDMTPTEYDHAEALLRLPVKNENPPRWRLSLRTFWTSALCFYSFQMLFMTFAAQTSTHAIVLIASIGITWAVALWVPYALVMEGIREAEDGMSPFEFEADWFAPERVRSRRDGSGIQQAFGRARVQRSLQDCSPLNGNGTPNSIPDRENGQGSQSGSHFNKPKRGRILARGCEAVYDESPSRIVSGQVPGLDRQSIISNSGISEGVGATILGIHNIAIVIPQFFIAILASIILREGSIFQDELPFLAVDTNQDMPFHTQFFRQNGVSVVWVLRLGGLAAFFAAILTRFVPLSRTERQLIGDRATLRQAARAESMCFDDEVSESESIGD